MLLSNEAIRITNGVVEVKYINFSNDHADLGDESSFGFVRHDEFDALKAHNKTIGIDTKMFGTSLVPIDVMKQAYQIIKARQVH